MKQYNYDCYEDNYIYIINVGRNAKENWELIDMSKHNDIWFHVADSPSSHVVLSVGDIKKPHRKVIKYCAFLCKSHSKVKNMNKVSIVYTTINNIVKSKNVGSVITKNTKIIKL